MEEVEVSRTIEASREAVERALSPRSIVEYAGTYEVRDVEQTDDGWIVEGGAGDLEVVLEFSEADAGYVYRQRDDRGPFGEMYTSVALADDDPVVVSIRSCFTFDMPLSWLTDRIAARERRTELRRLLAGLAEAVESGEDGEVGGADETGGDGKAGESGGAGGQR